MSVSETLYSLTKEGFDVIFSESSLKDPLIMSIEMTKGDRCVQHSIDYIEMTPCFNFNPDMALMVTLENMANEFKKGQAIGQPRKTSKS